MNAESTFAGYISHPLFWTKTNYDNPHMVWSATQGSRGCVVRVAPTSFASIHYRLLQARGTTKISFQTQTTPSTFRPSLLKKTLRMDGLFFLQCLCLESFCWWQRATQKQKTHQRNRHRGTVLLLELLKCFFYDEGSRIGGNFKKTGETGQVRRDCY